MRRILVLLAFATVGMVASVTPAQAEVTTNETVSVGFAGFVSCANGGAGEILSGPVLMHNLTTSTVNGNNVTGQFHFQPQGGSMVGAITGDTYRVTGVTQGTFNESLQNGQYTLTYVNNFRLIGPGSANNVLVHEIAHMTINANGDVAVRHDDLSIDCK